MNDALRHALAYARAGFSVIPIAGDGSKRPAIEWKEFQGRQASQPEILRWYTGSNYGVGIVCGAVSGGLEVLDFDSAAVWEAYQQALADNMRDKALSLPRVRTPSGGVHVYYRCRAVVEGNRKLARDAAGKTLIETRGEGGQVVAPGSPACCHPSGRLYVWEVPLTGVTL